MVIWEALDALSHQFELCGVDAQTAVVILTPAECDADTVGLVRGAVARTGAEALDVRPVGVGSGEVDRLLEGKLLGPILERADLLLDCLPEPIRSDHPVLDRDNLRVLRLGTTASRAHFHPPHASLRHRVAALADRLTSASRLTLSDAAGTWLRIEPSEAIIHSDHGLVTHPGSAGTFPSGWVELEPATGAVDGDLVVMPGDGNIAGRCLVSSPVRVCIRKGMITAIEGESPDADILRALLELSASTAAYAFAGLAVGLNPGSTPAGAMFDPVMLDERLARLAAGMITISFGSERLPGPRRANVVLTLSRRDLLVDDLPIVAAGVLQGRFAPDVYESPA